ncbi:MAG: hypothetical protein WCQ00_03430 [bacterium]
MSPEEILAFFEKQIVDEREVLVATKPMTSEQAREIYPYRPFSKYSESGWSGNNQMDDSALLMNELAVLCKICRAATGKKFVLSGVCPDCNGRSERHANNPRKSVKK